jgi:threonine aldolase
MRAAMAAAEVGDDVLDGDPTMRELEERIADILGTEAALWVPSGSMGNLIALATHLQRGDAFLAPEGAHVLDAELGTSAWLAGGMPRPMPHDAGPGQVSPAAVRKAAGTPGPYYTLRTTLLCLENTHNAAGGTVTPPAQHAALASAARDAGLRLHLDGARLWHAAVALDVPPPPPVWWHWTASTGSPMTTRRRPSWPTAYGNSAGGRRRRRPTSCC